MFICIPSASHLHSLHLRSNWADISTSPALSLYSPVAIYILNLSLRVISVIQFLTLLLFPGSSVSRSGRGQSLAKGERTRSRPPPLNVWRQMGRTGLYCLETKLAKLMVGGGAPGWAEDLQGQIMHTPGRVLEQERPASSQGQASPPVWCQGSFLPPIKP